MILAQSYAFDKSDLASRMELAARWSNRAKSESWNLGTALAGGGKGAFLGLAPEGVSY